MIKKYSFHFLFILLINCVSINRVLETKQAEIDEIKITYQFGKLKSSEYFDTTISITSRSEMFSWFDIEDGKDKVKTCGAHGNIQFLKKNNLVFNVRFSLDCKFVQLIYEGKVYDRRKLSTKGELLLNKYKNEIMKSIGNEWGLI